MDKIRGWFGGRTKPVDTAATTPALDLNKADAALQADGAATTADAAVQPAAAAAPDQIRSSSSSSSSSDAASSSSSTADGAGSSASPEASTSQQQPEEEVHEDVNPMLQTSLTKRFKGRFQPLQMPDYETIMQEDFMNNCAVRSCIAGGMGGLLGIAFGVFTASLDTQSVEALTPTGEAKPTRVVLKETWQLMKEKSRSYAKGFAGMGFLYSGTECMIERYRAKHDAMNATLAGCATGGLMAAPGGAKAMCFGCASFAAFSTAIEYFTGHM